MKTSELINAISEDREMPLAPGRALCLALIPGLVVAIALFSRLGLRPHFLSLLADPRFSLKLLVCYLLAALAGLFVLRLFRPGGSWRRALLLLALPSALLGVGVIFELFVVSPANWETTMIGHNAMFCLKTIPLLGIAPLIAILVALRNGAPERPAVAGAGAGLLAGAIGAALYASHCPDDSPLFVAVWYPIAIAFLTALGAAVGARLLRW